MPVNDAIKHRLSNKLNAGFSLIEVLISLLVIGSALIGLLSAQIHSLQYVNDSFHYTVSLVQANNVIEKIYPRLCELQHTNTALYEDATFLSSLLPQANNYSVELPSEFPSAMPYDFEVSVSWEGKQLDPNLTNELTVTGSYPELPSDCTP